MTKSNKFFHINNLISKNLKIRICFFFGTHHKTRHDVFKKMFQLQNFETSECIESVKGFRSLPIVYVKLFFRSFQLKYDLMFIPWWGIFTFPLARIITSKPIIYLASLSYYSAIVNERKKSKPDSLFAKLVYSFEKYVCKKSDLVLTETESQIDFFTKLYKLNRTKFRTIGLSADESKFIPVPFKNDEKILNVLYFGRFAFLHSTITIVESAKILADHKDIIFHFCGDGPTRKESENCSIKNGLKNVIFHDVVSEKELLEKISHSDIILGVFGDSWNANDSITNKVSQTLASQKPLITLESDAMMEIGMKNGENCIMVPSKNPDKIAEAIIFLKKNPAKRKQIAHNGYIAYTKKLSLQRAGEQFLQDISEYSYKGVYE